MVRWNPSSGFATACSSDRHGGPDIPRAAQTLLHPLTAGLAAGLPERSYPGFFSSAKSFALPSRHPVRPRRACGGYYIDFR